MESNRKNENLKKQKKFKRKEKDDSMRKISRLTQIDSVKRDMQFSVQRQLRRMEILERKQK